MKPDVTVLAELGDNAFPSGQIGRAGS